jgi:hypothetical protein
MYKYSPVFLALAWLAVNTGFAQEFTPEPSDWQFRLSAGAASWPRLSETVSHDGGSFDDITAVLQAGFYRRIAKDRFSDLRVGGELGFFSTESDIRGRFTDLTSQGFWVGPAVLYTPDWFSTLRLALKGGLGYYGVDFVEVLDYGSSFGILDGPFSSSSAGGHVGVSLEFPFDSGRSRHSIVLELAAHTFDFGRPGGTQGGTLNGPLYVANVGWGYGF